MQEISVTERHGCAAAFVFCILLSSVLVLTADAGADDNPVWRVSVESENMMVGFPFLARCTVPDDASPVKFSAKNLPDGLKINATSGMISGVPTKAGVKTVTMTARCKYGKKLKSAATKETFEVARLDSWAKGTYKTFKMVEETSDKVHVSPSARLAGRQATAVLTVGATGKISGKFVVSGKSYPFSASAFDSCNEGEYKAKATVKYGGKSYSLVIGVADGESYLEKAPGGASAEIWAELVK